MAEVTPAETGPECVADCDPVVESVNGLDANFWPRVWLKVGIALVLAGQGTILSLGLNTADPPLRPDQTIYWLLHGGLMLSAMIVFGILGGPLIEETLAALRQCRITIDALFALSVIGALAGSMVSSWRGDGAVYYEVVAIVLAIYTVGKALGVRTKALARMEATRLEAQFDHAVIEDGETLLEKPLGEVTLDDTVRVAPGEGIPVDGEIISGRAYVNEQPLSGEPAAVVRGEGDPVLAGTHSVDGQLRIRPTALKGQRRFDGVIGAIREARDRPTRLQAQADRLTRWFVPAVCFVSIATFVFWLPFVDLGRALFNAMAVLIVACPCALGLATPVAVWRGLATLARKGLVASSGDLLEVLSRAQVFAFDKTGTLSADHMHIQKVHLKDTFVDREDSIAQVIQGMESGITHPIALALMDWAQSVAPGKRLTFTEVKLVPGMGIEAIERNHAGEEIIWRLGSSVFCQITPDDADKSVFLTMNGKQVARFLLGEALRASTQEALVQLHKQGHDLVVLTGDPAPLWGSISGVRVESGLWPEDKVDRVRLLKEKGAVILVGDGINDVPAMAEADGSIAMEAGAGLSRMSADGILLGGNLTALPEAVDFSRRVVRSISSNIKIAAVYNFIGMSLAAGGVLHPVVAALLMLVSSTVVSARVLRASR